MQKTADEKLKKTAERLGIALERIPRHIAIIMDGNGRWARRKKLPRFEGHRQGGKAVERIVQHCVDIGIESLTLYSFSIENWKRPRTEVNSLMYLYERYLIQTRPTLMKNNVKVIHLGRLTQLPSTVQTELLKTLEATSDNSGLVLALALNYGGRTEIVDAVKKIAEAHKSGKLDLKDIDEQCISQSLYTAGLSEPDLLIRTANEMRVSNFLLWQISYSEFYVTKTLWPNFKKSDLDKAILAYAERNRRFGNIEDSD